MHQFVWASRHAYPPARWDLRHLGWAMHLVDTEEMSATGTPWLLDCRPEARSYDWRHIARADLVAAVGADDPDERARMLDAGLGEALSMRVALGELAVRLRRLAARRACLPRHRMAGPVRLDLFHRDARVDQSWLGLHPREFGLLWRLAEEQGRRVTRTTLLQDVWRLDHLPETNSLEVHVSRLRAKLAISGLGGLVETDPRGGYRLGAAGGRANPPVPFTRHHPLDSAATLRDGGARHRSESPAYAME